MSGTDKLDIDWLADLLAVAADAEIMPRFRRLDDGDIRQKTSAADLVTEADEAAERYITAALKERHPHALVVGEEAASADPSIVDGIGDAELAFTLDPVDGTFNFASGVPLFGVMLAAVVNGETVAGIIHDPVGNDFIMAERGGGSFIRRSDGEEFATAVADPVPVDQMTGAVSWAYLPSPDREKLALNQTCFLNGFGYRCAAHEYRIVASGFAHALVFGKVMPWDHLPGALILQEAGGHIAHFDGSDYRPGNIGGGLLAATDPDSWKAVREALWAD